MFKAVDWFGEIKDMNKQQLIEELKRRLTLDEKDMFYGSDSETYWGQVSGRRQALESLLEWVNEQI